MTGTRRAIRDYPSLFARLPRERGSVSIGGPTIHAWSSIAGYGDGMSCVYICCRYQSTLQLLQARAAGAGLTVLQGRTLPQYLTADAAWRVRPDVVWVAADEGVTPQMLEDIAAARRLHLPVQMVPLPTASVAEPADTSIPLAWIPPGSFDMGSPKSEEGRWPDEDSVHRVTLSSGFWMGRFPVTQAQWKCVMGDNLPNCEGDRRPVVGVSWHDCAEFCARLTSMERAAGCLPSGMGYRLPTEAEWEYACRAGNQGARYGSLDSIAWYDQNNGGKIHPVGQKQPNRWGLYDMLGNVWEWCQDDWHSRYQGAPSDGSAWVDSPRGCYRIRRGGCWNSDASNCRAAYRSSIAPGHHSSLLGFRVVCQQGSCS